MKHVKMFALVLAAWCCAEARATAEDKLRIVTTLSVYADIAKAVGGEAVEVSYVAPPRFDPHFVEPRPSDVFRLKRADLFIHSGLDLEAWREPLVDAAARADLRWGGERQLDLSTGISLLEVPAHQLSRAEGDVHIYGNPHYWLDPRNGLIIAEEIAAQLSKMDPNRAAVYQSGLQRFAAKLRDKIPAWQALLQPHRGRKLVGYHKGWVYLMAFADLKMELFLEPKPGIPPTPRHLQAVLAFIKEQRVPGIVQATFDPKEAAENVAAKTGIKVVLLCSNVGEKAACSDYISLFEYNVGQLLEVLNRG